MNSMVLTAIRLYFSTLQRLAPKVAGRQAFQMFCTPRFRRPIPSATEEIMARAEALELDVEGQRVAVFLWRGTGGEEAPRVILAHGWESRAARLSQWVDPLLEQGYEVVAYDAPAHGASEGRRSTPLLFARTLRAVVDHLGPARAIVGHSLGAYSSLMAASVGEWIDQEDLDVDRIVAVAGAESGREAMAMFCRILGLGPDFLPLILDSAAEQAGGRSMADFDARRIWTRRSIPTLWLHAPEDEEVAFEGAEAVAATCPHVQLEAVPGLGHHRIVRDPGIIQRGVEFLALEQSNAA